MPGVDIPLNPLILAIPYGDRKRIMDAARGKVGVINLSSGMPDLPMPPFIVDRLKASLDSAYMPYTNYYGFPELREKIALHLASNFGIRANPETEILVTVGIQEGLYLAMRTILTPGDEVLMPSPHYAEYYLNAVACGAVPILVPLEERDGWVPDIERLEQAITPRTRALVFCNPNNPLGTVWPRKTLEQIAGLVTKHALVVLVDEIYRDFMYTDPPPSIGALPGMAERTFTFGGFSKSFMMMGLRMGFLVAPAQVMRPIKNLHYCVTLCPSYLGQMAALAALDCPKEQLEPMWREYGQRLEILYDGITAIPGVTCVRPQGSFYMFPNISCLGLSAMDLALRLIDEAGVMILPGTEFGPYGEGHFRLSAAAPRDQLRIGLERLQQFAKERQTART
jgi:aminotransferase